MNNNYNNNNFIKLFILLTILNISFCGSIKCQENCIICPSVNICIECKIGYYVHPYLQQCLPCASNCATCAGNKPFECLTCRNKFYKKQYILPSNNNCKSGFPVKNSLSSIVQVSVSDNTKDYVQQASFSSDGRYFVMAETNNKLKLFNQQNGEFKEVNTIQLISGSEINSVIFSDNGKYLAVKTSLFVNIYNAEDISLGNSSFIKTINDIQKDIAFSPDGRYIAYGVKSDGLCKIFNSMTGNFDEFVTTVQCPLNQTVMAFSQNGRFLVICSNTEMCFILTSDKGIFDKKILITQQPYNSVTSIDFSRDGKYMVLVENNKPFWIYKIEEGNISYLSQTDNHASKAAFSMDSQFIAVNSIDYSSTYIYQIVNESFTLFHTLSKTEDPTCLAFSPNGKYFADCESTFCKIYSFCTE